LYNPLIGFVSTAYSAQVHPHIALSTRFGVNVYSYESDLTVGGEWWIGRRRGKRENAATSASSHPISPVQSAKPQIEDKVEKTEVRVGEEPAFGSVRAEAVEGEVDGPFAKDRIYPRTPISAETSMVQKPSGNTAPSAAAGDERKDDDEREGVLKARVSGNWVSLAFDATAYYKVAGLLEMKAGRSSGVSADVASQYPYYTKRVYGTAWSR
jgi:distribution and morphology protein 10